jgi:hypothetical protein
MLIGQLIPVTNESFRKELGVPPAEVLERLVHPMTPAPWTPPVATDMGQHFVESEACWKSSGRRWSGGTIVMELNGTAGVSGSRA